jgi:hypothetical protein
MFDFAICIDITQHMNELNISHQKGNRLLKEMFDRMTSFQRNILLWAAQLQSSSMTHFPVLRTEFEIAETAEFQMELLDL